jgi:phosphoribosylformylglycinamidine cyclo-ligase
MPHTAYRESGVDTDEATKGLTRLIGRIARNWPPPGAFGAVQLEIGYFANVVDLGGIGLAISTDGVGSKAIIAREMGRYETIGIDCVAVNVNDLICVGARPAALVDYIAVERADAAMLGAIAVGLAQGAEAAGIAIVGGETAQLPDIVAGFDLAGTAVGTVALDRIVDGRHLEPGDLVVGLASSGIHANGLSLARKAFFKRDEPLPLDYRLPQSGALLGEELLHPTAIYVPEIMEILARIPDVKALVHITSDGLLNLVRVRKAGVGFRIDDLPPSPEIFRLIQQYGNVGDAEMFEVYNMGVGFCVIVEESRAALALEVLAAHRRRASIIGQVVADPTKGVEIREPPLVGHGKRFRAA